MYVMISKDVPNVITNMYFVKYSVLLFWTCFSNLITPLHELFKGFKFSIGELGVGRSPALSICKIYENIVFLLMNACVKRCFKILYGRWCPPFKVILWIRH